MRARRKAGAVGLRAPADAPGIGGMVVPIKALTERPERVGDDMPDRVYERAIERSGLVALMTACYPIEAAQHN